MKRIISVALVILCTACEKNELNVDIQETAQQIGDVMASVDESGGSSGALASLEVERKVYARINNRLNSSPLEALARLIKPVQSASAAVCGASTFNSCTNNVITRDFNGCTVGEATFTGSVSLTYVDAGVNGTCQMTMNNHSITRVPNFQVTGRRTATLAVSKTGTNGQVLTMGATIDDFTFTNDGIRRVFSLAGTDLFDYTTQTTAPITITGRNRNGRVMSGGTLRVTNNISSVTCDYTPTAVTWGANCNCPTSGMWTGSCSDGKTSAITINSCGAATFVMGEDTENLTFDRCSSI